MKPMTLQRHKDTAREQIGTQQSLSSDSESESDEPIEVEAMTSTEFIDVSSISTKEVFAATETGIPASSNGHATPSCSKTVLGDTSRNRRRERPLREYVPNLYICVLEGTLLTNGDLKGSWRMRRGDSLSNEFRMVLMDRGVYDGGFNITTVNSDDPTTTSLQEVHDRWFAFDWCSTTARSSNIWGRGQNLRFGECHLLGSHDAITQTVVLYKVEEAELRRAQIYARDPSTILTRRTPASSLPETRQQRQQQAMATRNGKAAMSPSVSASPTGESTAYTKQPHSCSSTGGDFVVAASAVVETASAGTNYRSVKGKRRIYPPGHPAYNRTRAQPNNTVRILGAISSCVSSDSGSGSDSDGSRSSNRDIEQGQAALGSKHKETGSPLNKTKAPAIRGTLPGFSGFEDDEDTDHQDKGKRKDDIIDLAVRAAKMQKDKTEILENFSALANSLGNAKTDFEQRISKTTGEELAMLEACRAIRRKREDLEAGWKVVNVRLERAKKDEEQLLKAWNDKWAYEVQPFIAQHEKEVKRKAEELERKTKQAEKEKLELQQEFAQLHNVKKIATLDVSGDAKTALL